MNILAAVQNQRGVTLMVVLVMVVIVGLTAGIAGSTWKTVMQREREEQLLWAGDQYRRAIESYVQFGKRRGSAQPGGQVTSIPFGQQQQAATFVGYPSRLEELLRDPRAVQTVRHIRRLYKDPLTGEDFELVKDSGGWIRGVKTTSKDEPFKKDGFELAYEDFKDADSYQKWEFIYEPARTRSATTGTSQTGTVPAEKVVPTPSN